MRDPVDHPDGRRYQYDEYDDRPPISYDSHYDEGEDPVAFVNIIDMDIPFFQLVWLIFKILLATIVAAGFLFLLGQLLYWILSLPVIQNLLPDGSTWFQDLMNSRNS